VRAGFGEVAASIRRLISGAQLDIHFQPIISLVDGSTVGYEALTRVSGESPWCSPGPLFEAAAEAGVLDELECHVRRLAVTSFPWHDPKLKLFLNYHPAVTCDLSGHGSTAGRRCSGCPVVKVMCSTTGRLVLELPEDYAVSDDPNTEAMLLAVRSANVDLALDDVGTGNSTLKTALLVRPSWVKIDRSLVHQIEDDLWKQVFVRFLVEGAKMLGVRVVAEGVETPAQMAMLQSLGIETAQGFLLGRPAPLMAYDAYVDSSSGNCRLPAPRSALAATGTSGHH